MSMPSEQSAWTLSSALAIAMSSASVLVGLLISGFLRQTVDRRRLPLWQASVEGMTESVFERSGARFA
jgi:hypothetical protein